METIHGYSRYGALIGVFAEMHPIVFKLITALAPGGDVGVAYIIKFTSQTIAEYEEREYMHKERGKDILSSLLVKQQKNPELFTTEDVHYHTLPNVLAGAETTGITMSAIIYFLWKNPRTLAKLREELDARQSAEKSRNIITVKEAADCSYLQAVIKESMRLHPGNGLGLTRVIPKGGLFLAGRFFPEGVSHYTN